MNEGMVSYTKWAIAHPWHCSGSDLPVPKDCDCEWCSEQRLKRQFQANLATYYWNEPDRKAGSKEG